MVSEQHYDTAGNSISDSHAEAVDTIFGYTGRALDESTGLQNNLYRWYDSAVGRWASEDPIGFAAGDANLNRYVGNESTGWVDPSGLLPVGGIVGGDATAGETGVDFEQEGFEGNIQDAIRAFEDFLSFIRERASSNALKAISGISLGTAKFQTDTCQTYAFGMRDCIKQLKHPGIDSVQVETFALYPNDDAPWMVQLTLTTGHAAVRVRLIDGREFYFDNGGFGGKDGRFQLDELPSYAYPGTPSFGILESFEDYWRQAYPEVWQSPKNGGIFDPNGP